MTNMFRVFTLSVLATALVACDCDVASNKNADSSVVKEVENVSLKEILTADKQAALTPDEVIDQLKKGNENFVSNQLTAIDFSAQRSKAATGQYPKAIVLSCVDSRVPVENIFDLGIGDIFVARVAGNIENKDIVGSMEYATAVAGSKVVVVMGHTSCGAVKSAINNTDAASMEMHSLQHLLDEIKPAMASIETDGEKSSKNVSFTTDVVKNNAVKTVEDIRKQSPKMAALEKEGKIKIVSALYDIATGKVTFME
ncbi:MAG: carbonic anhydrase family protein [Flavobacteriales bacterium]